LTEGAKSRTLVSHAIINLSAILDFFKKSLSMIFMI
jgi:hypothetical protein